jgi:hypothetical protein
MTEKTGGRRRRIALAVGAGVLVGGGVLLAIAVQGARTAARRAQDM